MSTKTTSRREQLRLQQQAAREKRIRTWVTFGLIGVVVLALVGGLAWVLGANRSGGDPAGSSVQGGAVDGYTLLIGAGDAPVTVDVYQDYLCPYCGRFERANRADLEALVADGTARLRLHPMAFLDAQSAGSRYSSRAADAAVTVARLEPDKLLAFNAVLYDQQPAEGARGLTDDQLAAAAAGAGVSQQTTGRFAAEENAAFVKAATQAAFDDGVQATPTVRINGQDFSGDLYIAGPLQAAVRSAAGASSPGS